MLLIIAIAVLGLVVAVGGWLGSLYLLFDTPPTRLTKAAALHGIGGVVGVGILLVALRVPPGLHAVRMGAGKFGTVSAGLIVAALVAGLTIFALHMRGKQVSVALVASHGMFAISGYVLLLTYMTMLR